MDESVNPGSHEPEKGSVKESDMLRSYVSFAVTRHSKNMYNGQVGMRF